MTLQFSDDVRNARLDAIETAIGASPTLEIRSGAAPADCAQADSGVLLAQIALPANWMADALDAVKEKAGTWEDAAADANGTAGHYRIKDTGGNCHVQGTITEFGAGGDMEIDSTELLAGQKFTVVSYQWTEGNA